MLRLGEIIKADKDPFMVASNNYEEVVRELSSYTFPSDDKKLLACLVISQTERQYKKYLLKVLAQLESLDLLELIKDWQEKNLEFNDNNFHFLLSNNEVRLLSGKDIETHLEEYEKGCPSLFNDGLNTAFYPSKKKGMLYLRRMILYCKDKEASLNDFQKLVLYFITAQLLLSWESSCTHLGLMLLNNWKIKEMAEWFIKVWPIYEVQKV